MRTTTPPTSHLSTETLIDLGGRFRLRAIEYRARGLDDQADSWDRTADRWLRKVLDRLLAQRAIDLSWLREVSWRHPGGTIEYVPEDPRWACEYPGPQGDWDAWERARASELCDDLGLVEAWEECPPSYLESAAKEVAADQRKWAELVEKYGDEIWEECP